MPHFNSLRRPGLLVSLLGLSSLALLGAACSGAGTSDEPAGEHVDSAESALTAAQCSYFDVNGKNQICHYTGSASHPYTIIKTSEQGCINGHTGHAGDYLTSTDPSSPTYDPTCQGGGCLPVGAPTDATLECCDGLVSQNGTCVDLCAVQPCENGGACTASGAGYTCSCAPGYSGANCEINIDECASSPCQNGGTCTDGVNSYTCSCAPGYAGASCEINIDECASSPCANGVCADGVNSYACTCSPGWTGQNCDINIDECAAQPCQNGGTCTDAVNSFTCQCPPEFTGATCETPVVVGPCASSPCQNGGACIDGGSTYTCQCEGGFSGTNCTVFNAGDPHGALAPTIADIDGDGKPDVLIANAELGSAATPAGSLSVLRGNGNGTLQGENYYVGAPLASNAVVAADVNGDGWLDAITVNGQTNLGAVDGSISVYLNAGAASPGTFGAPTSFTTGAPSSLHLCAADFNGDGAIDIATTSVSNRVSVMFGDGVGGFGAPTLIAIANTGGVQSTIATADFNGDGQSDLVVTSPASARISILINQGGGSFAAPVAYSNNQNGQTSGLAFGDFDGDGTLDILSNGAAGRFLFFFKGTGTGTFATGVSSTVTSSAVANSALGVVAGDFSGDGKLDAYVLRTAAAGGIFPLTGAGNGTFSVGPLVPTGASPGLNAIATGDLDSDGHPDVVVTNRGSATVSVVLNSL